MVQTARTTKHHPAVVPFHPPSSLPARHDRTGRSGKHHPSFAIPRPTIRISARPHRLTRKSSSHDRPDQAIKLIRPTDPVDRIHDQPAMIVLTVPKTEHDPTLGRASRPTVRTVRSTRSQF
ncbi:unnamed protein product [Microthlaspi erraticum]|uniref:Uncharacterized protein n=1 Tax=Microthlaspi erraticum TaxID=1685480 RepID=A0A6D2I8D7_9BRAS|nr:unnamed protein product [Microthlaspi erraticum]